MVVAHKSGGDHITGTLPYAKKQDTLIIGRGSESYVDFDFWDLTTGHCQSSSLLCRRTARSR